MVNALTTGQVLNETKINSVKYTAYSVCLIYWEISK